MPVFDDFLSENFDQCTERGFAAIRLGASGSVREAPWSVREALGASGKPLEASGSVLGASGASGRLPGAPGGIWRKFIFFHIFNVFGHSVIEFVMKLDENFCPCGHVKSGNRAKMGPKEVGGSGVSP